MTDLTPHIVRLNDGQSFPPSGQVARLAVEYQPTGDGLTAVAVFGPIQGLPEPEEGTIYVASALVAQAAANLGRTDVYSPATGHPQAVRNADGQVVSVPFLVRQPN